MADSNTKVEKTKDKPAEDKTAARPSTKPKNDIMGDGTDDGDLILENERVSIPLTPENAKFTRSSAGAEG